jgi:DNA-binding GntR family transcriptional regulator
MWSFVSYSSSIMLITLYLTAPKTPYNKLNDWIQVSMYPNAFMLDESDIAAFHPTVDGPISLAREETAMIFKPPKSISDQIYEHLKTCILNREIESGERLTQEKVAADLATSRTPIREAFRRLEQDCLIERLPQGGVRVTPVDENTIEHILGFREALEAYSIELACNRISKDLINELEHIERQATALLENTDLEDSEKRKRLFALNTAFHDIIYEATGNPYLIKVIQQIRQMVMLLRATGLRDRSAWDTIWSEHSQITKYLRQGDKKSAVRCIRQHIKNAIIYTTAMARKKGSRH